MAQFYFNKAVIFFRTVLFFFTVFDAVTSSTQICVNTHMLKCSASTFWLRLPGRSLLASHIWAWHYLPTQSCKKFSKYVRLRGHLLFTACELTEFYLNLAQTVSFPLMKKLLLCWFRCRKSYLVGVSGWNQTDWHLNLFFIFSDVKKEREKGRRKERTRAKESQKENPPQEVLNITECILYLSLILHKTICCITENSHTCKFNCF